MDATIPVRKLRAAVRSVRSVGVAVSADETTNGIIVLPVSKRSILDSIRRLRGRGVKDVRAAVVFGQLVIG